MAVTDEDAATEILRGQTVRNATAAFHRAQDAMEAGDLTQAAAWIRRAHRLAPGDAAVQLLLASITVHSEPGEAVRVLRALTDRLPWHRDAAVALGAALLRAGCAADAAEALAAMLRRMTPPDSDLFRTIAAAICAGSGQPGWVALTSGGECRVTLAAAGGTVQLAIDGQEAGRFRGRPGQSAARALPAGWHGGQMLVATLDGRALLGSPLRPARFAAVDGFVTVNAAGAISGWARSAMDQDRSPELYVSRPDAAPQRLELALMSTQTGEDTDDQRPRWHFEQSARPEHTGIPASILGPDGRDVWGSPVWPGAEREAARLATHALAVPVTGRPADPFRPLPTSLLHPSAPRPSLPGATRRRPPCDVVVPVYAGLAELDRCLRSLEQTLPAASRLILVNDGTPDPAIAARLAEQRGPRTTILTHDRPLGFPAAINAGLAALGPARGRDVVILNADTAVSGKWLERLSTVAHSDPAIGSCTPLTNDGTIVCYPEPGEPADMPDPAALRALNERCWQANQAEVVDIPTGVGFCMLLKGACLAEVGLFRTDVFAQGYGEENDWCLRAAHLGWHHVAAPGVFVGHSGGRSFGAAKVLLLARNAAVLERLHPGYAAYVQTALAAEPLLPARRRVDRLALLQAPGERATALVMHDSGGGVARHVAARCAALAVSGRRAIVLSPGSRPGRCVLSLGIGEGAVALPNLAFDLPRELPALTDLLREAGVEAFEIHHLLNHDPCMMALPARLGVPYEVFVHDYGHWCPRITLTSRSQRYCGEPLAVADCEACVADLGSRYGDVVTVRGLRADSARLLQDARRVAVACEDVAARIRRQFPGTRPEILPWEDETRAEPRPPPPGEEVHVVIAGAIGVEKGYDVLLGCARDAARRQLPLRFTVVGHTIDDARLIATGRAFVTGRFSEDEGLPLVLEQHGTLGFVPSVWPETWCYALSMLMQAGLPVMAFSLGAQGERITRSGRGWLLPLGISVTKINDTLVNRGLQTLHTTDLTVI